MHVLGMSIIEEIALAHSAGDCCRIPSPLTTAKTKTTTKTV